MAVLSVVAAACTSSPEVVPPAEGTSLPAARPRAPSPGIEVVAYTGAFARDEAVRAFAAAAEDSAPPTLESLRERAGLQFVRDRGARVVLVDGTSVPPAGRVDVRVVDGLRRPEIRIRAGSVAAREFVVEKDLAPLLAEAALLAAAGERTAPSWVREGMPLHLAGALGRRVLESVLARPDVSLRALDDPALAPGFRAAALGRIAVGERPVQRYLARRLAGADEETSLREIGIEREEFLDAAATTEGSRAFRDLAEVEGLVAVREAKARFLRGDLDGAAEVLDRTQAAGRVEAERLLVAAEVALALGDPLAAEWGAEQSLAADGPGARRRDARWLLVRTARADEDRRRRLVAFVREFPDDPRCEEAAQALRLPPAVLRDSVGEDAQRRAAAASALGSSPETCAVEAHEALRPLLSDGHPAVRRAAATALGVLSRSAEAASDLDALGGDADGTVRAAALEALARIDPARAQSRASLFLDDPSSEVRAAAERVLAGAAPPASEE